MRHRDWTLQIQSTEPILDLITAMHALAAGKLTLKSGGTAKGQNDCLAFVKPWVWSPTPHMKNDSLIMLLIQHLFSHISLFLNKNFTFKTGKQQYSYSQVIDWPLVEIFLNYWMSFLLTVTSCMQPVTLLKQSLQPCKHWASGSGLWSPPPRGRGGWTERPRPVWATEWFKAQPGQLGETLTIGSYRGGKRIHFSESAHPASMRP